MSFLYNLIRTVFEWAIFIAMMGGIGEATAKPFTEAGHARAYGLVSLRVLNQSLVGSMHPAVIHVKAGY